MGVINILDKHVAELIAAGEVVERPSSVIKELVENSVDAGAKNITIEIKNGGTTFIRVNDDGCGIMKDDVKNAFLRHATSKVKFENDLDKISTLGFRGEALASISAVSKLQLITRNKFEKIGSSYEIFGGEEISFFDAGCPVGTTFIIRDLFYNVPARMKFLKKDVSEGNAVSAFVDKVALSHPEISFTYIRDGRQMLKTSGDGKLKSAIYSVYGREFALGLIPVNYELNGVKVYGYISKPVESRPNRNMQNFFINGRYVKTRTASIALEEAFKGSIMVGKFPSCVLHIEISYEAIDVNVHPAKVEVRFINEKPVFDAVYHAVKSALLSSDESKNVTFKNPSAFNDIKTPSPFNMAKSIIKNQNSDSIKPENKEKKEYNPFVELNYISSAPEKISDKKNNFSENVQNNKRNFSTVQKKSYVSSPVTEEPAKKEQIKNYLDFLNESSKSDTLLSQNNDNISAESTKNLSENKNINNDSQRIDDEIKPLIETQEPTFRYIGEAFKTYIIIEKDKELILIDKHAAHERIIYERLKKEKGAGFSQLLLKPIPVTLSKTDYDASVNNLDMFRECAFDVDDFGNGVLLVRSAPQYLDESDIVDAVEEMAQHIAENKKDIRSEKMDWIYHNVACRAAIKAGNKSIDKELIEIAKLVVTDPNIRYCPHGRPTSIVISKHEIEKQFGRV